MINSLGLALMMTGSVIMGFSTGLGLAEIFLRIIKGERLTIGLIVIFFFLATLGVFLYNI